MKNYIILPGTGDTPYDNWFEWLKTELENQGFNVCVPYMPQDEFCNYKNWEKVMRALVISGVVGRETTFVCHDISATFITRFLVKNRVNVEGVIAVSPFNKMLGVECDNLNKTFVTKKDTLSKIYRFVKFYHVFVSTNDPIISDADCDEFNKITNAKVHKVTGAGHFDAASGYLKFPEIIELIDNINRII